MILSLIVAGALAAVSPDGGAGCRTLVVPKAAGEPVTAEDTETVECPDRTPGGQLYLDAATRVPRARRDLAPGAMLGRVAFPAAATVAAGQRVTLNARIGHVAISRPATALQPGRPGRPLFVRLDDGQIVAAPVHEVGL